MVCIRVKVSHLAFTLDFSSMYTFIVKHVLPCDNLCVRILVGELPTWGSGLMSVFRAPFWSLNYTICLNYQLRVIFLDIQLCLQSNIM